MLKKAVEDWADVESRRVSAQVGHLLEELLMKKKLLMTEPSSELKSELYYSKLFKNISKFLLRPNVKLSQNNSGIVLLG
jgi:hypothetical protein